MKYFTLIIAIILTSCGSQKINKTMNSADFMTDEQPYYESWVGGAPGSGGGVSLYFPASIIEGHTLQAVYFQGIENNIANFITNDKKMLVTRFSSDNENRDMYLDAQKEYGNNPPELKELPFKLLKNQAVIAFEVDGETRYVKLENIEKKETITYPSAPPRGD